MSAPPAYPPPGQQLPPYQYAQPPYPDPYMAQQQQPQPAQPGYPMAAMPPYNQNGASAPPQIGFAQPGGYPPPGQPSVPPGYGAAPGYGQPPVVTSYQQPLQSQPIQYAPPPPGGSNPNIPPGLEYLTMIDQLLVKQKVELLEAFVGFETNNKYTIKNSLGQHVYYAVEENDFCTRNCLGAARPFEMIIMDNQRSEIMRINRPYRCSSCCCPCFLQEIEVMGINGQLLGSVSQNWSVFCPSFTIKNGAGDSVLKIEGPFCTFSMCGDVEFQVLSLDGTSKVGKITKQWTGLAREMFTDADYFGVTFPLDLDVNIKAVLLAATFLIDFMFFEKTGNKENDRIGML